VFLLALAATLLLQTVSCGRGCPAGELEGCNW